MGQYQNKVPYCVLFKIDISSKNVNKDPELLKIVNKILPL